MFSPLIKYLQMESYYSEIDLDKLPVQLAVVGITLKSNGVMSPCPDSVKSKSFWRGNSKPTCTRTHRMKPFNVSQAHDEHPAFSTILLDPMSAAITHYNAQNAVPDRRLCEGFELELKPTETYHLVDVLALLVRLLYYSNIPSLGRYQ